MKYSVIIPVYNRPDEARELLESLCAQTCRDFEVVIVEDGSAIPCKEVAEAYADRLDIHYYVKENGGPGRARNYGVERARGEYVLILDSDAVLPEGYIAAVEDELEREPADAFGGPDRAHPDFTPMQKAINYAMTSFFTTGGIRGGKKKLDKFYPRSFNMGVRREVYQALGGFSDMRFGEDIDFSTRIFKGGYRCRLFPEAWVWHKRRTDLKKFFKQVHNSGIARIHLSKRHPGTLKLVHLLPAVFTLGCALLLVLAAVAAALGCPHWWVMLMPLALFALIIMADASRQEHSVGVGLRAIAAAYVQLTGYGTGFLRSWWQRCVRGKGEFEAFKKNFYK
ncbi:MAG: glycosyltransferase [Bacteroidales bacterium]|nr:glycosyltransferase [Bacteroidales bacterium]MCI7646260.1 glycosyltransferase [Bacteroidales bacterium]